LEGKGAGAPSAPVLDGVATMPSDLEALEAFLRVNPEDREAWLVYADLLIEEGDVRGELVALYQQLAAGRLSAPDARARLQRVQALETSCRSKWLSELEPPAGASLQWRFGFVVEVGFGRSPDSLDAFARLCACRGGRFLSGLDLSGWELGAEGAARLAASCALQRARRLNLAGCHLGPEGVLALLPSCGLHVLRALDLSSNSLGDEGARAIAQASPLRPWTELDLTDNDIGRDGLALLLASPALQELQVLSLGGNPLGDAGAQELAQSRALCGLRVLHIANTGLGEVGHTALEALERRGCRVYA
jgi:uncharacterized protein (TIGR02996 family)